jgi:hypothetical protein
VNILELSDDALKALHLLISEALKKDDLLPRWKKQWGVREYPEWKQRAEEFEGEMKRRDIAYEATRWS